MLQGLRLWNHRLDAQATGTAIKMRARVCRDMSVMRIVKQDDHCGDIFMHAAVPKHLYELQHYKGVMYMMLEKMF